ncbi:DUF2569 family protein [Flagellimonas myxillae]|uniref:DUF2569 family protein n=1 Tax=Flagellimonas myxillae TaxID=2942214 RepID=UPI00201F0F1A|nr:DUF2569 family protein [Muricauda myxillae]MCL6267175.1 DUF2569 family protein [Muricauda myxillae]
MPFKEYYSNLELDKLLELSEAPHKVNIEGVPFLIDELDKRGEKENKNKVEEYYQQTDKFKFGHLKISGWLWIILIALIINMIRSSINIFELLQIGFEKIESSPNTHMKFDIYLYYGIEIFMVIFSIVLIAMMLSFNKGFRKFMVFLYIISVGSSFYFGLKNSEISGLIIFQAVFAMIWSYYLLFAEKPKKIFIK